MISNIAVPGTLLLLAAPFSLAATIPPTKNSLILTPERTLTCVLGRSTNLDPSRNQRIDEIISEGRHRFTLRLPAKAINPADEPDPSDDPAPVDARTSILDDPDQLTGGVPARFDRVVDLWPRRVEMTTIITPPLINLIIVSAIDTKAGKARLFMTKARDAASLDLDHVYQGDCSVTVALPKVAKGG